MQIIESHKSQFRQSTRFSYPVNP